MRNALMIIVLCGSLSLAGEAAAAPASKNRPQVEQSAPLVKHVTPAKPVTREQKIQAFLKAVREMGAVSSSCSLKGKNLKGKVQVVSSFPDLKVQRVTSFPDLKVQWVDSFPDSCGKWKSVTSFPDFKIQWVTSFPDLKIQEVTSFPGVP